MKRYAIVIAALCLAAGPAFAADQGKSKGNGDEKQSKGKASLKTQKQKVSYSIGMTIARNIKRDGLDVNANLVAAGVRDVLSGKQPRLSQQEMQAALTKLQQQMQQQQAEQQKQQAAEQKKAAAANKKKGEQFLAKNKSKEGVKELESGLQYKVLEAGDGKSPKASDVVKTHYKGTLIDGTVFDSSYQRGEPATFPVNRVIQGWTQALQEMKVGGKWKLFIPPELAYGQQGAGQAIGPNETLIFEVELLGIEEQSSQQGQGGGSN